MLCPYALTLLPSLPRTDRHAPWIMGEVAKQAAHAQNADPFLADAFAAVTAQPSYRPDVARVLSDLFTATTPATRDAAYAGAVNLFHGIGVYGAYPWATPSQCYAIAQQAADVCYAALQAAAAGRATLTEPGTPLVLREIYRRA